MVESDLQMPGFILGNRYRIEGLIGEGGMAQVYRAFDMNLMRTVAVKVMHPELASNQMFVKLFESEARAAARLGDAHIVSIHDWNWSVYGCYIVMEYVDGLNLRELRKHQGTLFPHVAASIARQVCQALDVAHGHGIVHRDIKPSNIMITRSGIVKMADFGIARVQRGGEQPCAIAGTKRYMSPEQASGGSVDRRSDIYSLGLTLYEMCGGRVPAQREMERWVPQSLAAAGTGSDPDLDAIISKCTHPDRRMRYQTVRELDYALAGYLMDFGRSRGALDFETFGAKAPKYWALAFGGSSKNFIRIDSAVTLGRTARADICLPSPSISQIHAKLEPKGCFLYLEDLGSSNRTRVNGIPISRAFCMPGDTVSFGEVSLMVGCME